MPSDNSLLEQVYRLRSVLTARATGEGNDDTEYRGLRRQLVAAPGVRSRLPRFVVRSYTLGEFWNYIQPKFSRYRERRAHIAQEFEPLIAYLESGATTPLDEAITEALDSMDSTHVRRAWERALERRSEDPEGAITAARTLLETLCKHILDESPISYADDADLPKLFHTTLESLNIAPSQQTEPVFRRFLGNCESMVSSLASLRNRLSDAHGKGKDGASPAPYHAELAVNLAGAVATFLVAVWEEHEQP